MLSGGDTQVELHLAEHIFCEFIEGKKNPQTILNSIFQEDIKNSFEISSSWQPR